MCCSRIVHSWWQSVATDGGCKQYASHVTFFSCLRACVMMSHTTLAQVFVRVISSMCHVVVCLISLRPSLRTLHLSLPSSTSSSWTLTTTFSLSMWMLPEQDPLCTSPNEESGPLANNALPTGCEPNFFDDYHFSETTEIFIQESSSDIDTVPSYLHDAEISDDTIGRALSSPLFTQKQEEPAGRRQAYHSLEESLLPSQSLSVVHVKTERPVNELSSLSSQPKSRRRKWANQDSPWATKRANSRWL